MIKVESYGLSNVGMKRAQNEDSYLINNEIGLYMVADGMGGHLGGEYASKLAVTTVEELMHKFRYDPEVTQIVGVNTDGADPSDQLKHAIREAGKRIYQQAAADENLRGMGTTAVAVLLDSHSVFVANVGDSRAYLVRQAKIQQITQDHSLVGEQVRAGILSEADAKSHKFKNIITRSIGYQEEVDIDVIAQPVFSGDRIVMCSDGLSNLLEDQEIADAVSQHSLTEACERLINAANSRGGDDNITVLIIQVLDIP